MTRPVPQDARGIIDPVTMMRHVEFARYPAGADLDGVVDWFWSVRWHLTDGVEHHQQVLNHPSGHISIGTVDDDGPLAAPRGRLHGVLTGMSSRHLVGAGWTVAAKTTVGGLGVLLDVPAARATGQTLPLAALRGLDEPGVIADVVAEDDQTRRVEILRSALAGLLRRRDPDDVAQARTVATIARTAETDRSVRRAEDLAERAGMGLRTLQRLFTRHVGVPPAWVIRRWRLIDALEQARLAGGPDRSDWAGWAALAADLGYSDQSHLSRDVRRHLGMSPGAYLDLLAAPAG